METMQVLFPMWSTLDKKSTPVTSLLIPGMKIFSDSWLYLSFVNYTLFKFLLKEKLSLQIYHHFK